MREGTALLAITTMLLGWALGLAVAIVGLFLGLSMLRTLARRRLSWWGSLVAPLLLYGPALGLLVAAAVRTGSVEGALYWEDGCPWSARLAWSLILFFGATALFGFVRAFLRSRFVAVEMGVQIPDLLLDGLRILLMLMMVFVVVGGVWQGQQYFSSLITAAGLGTAVVVFSLQETLQNFIAGVAIVAEHTYNTGEWVWVGDEEGEVVAITRRTTKIRTRTNDVVTIPNRLVMSSKVRNESLPTAIHADFVYVSASYADPPNRVREVLRRAALEVPKVLRDPAPIPRVHKYADSGVDYQLKIFMTDIASVPDIKSDVMAQIWYQFRREGIEIPYPVRELRRRASAATADTAREKALLARLSSVPFLAALPPDVLQYLADDATVEDYGAGERVVLQGEPGDTCYVVDSGRVAVLVTDGRSEQQVAILDPGSLFGEMSLLTGEPRSATVRTVDDARLLAIGSRALRTALERAPELATQLAEVATLRREGLLEAKAGLDAQARARVTAGTKRLGDLIRRFFRLPDEPA